MSSRSLPFALVMEQGSVAEGALQERPRTRGKVDDARVDLLTEGDRPARAALLERMLAILPPDVAVIATTGKCGRELFTLDDREQHLYQVGSMGCAAGMGLGVAMSTGRRTLVLDGDGAVLMKLGTLATVGAYRPEGFIHAVMDNGVHDSTGGQATSSPAVELADAALACGYRRAFACDGLDGWERALRAALVADDGPVLIHVRMRPGSMEKLGRPTVAPHEVARRFRTFLQSAAAA